MVAVPILWLLLLALALRGILWLRIDPVTFDSAVYFEMADLVRGGRWSEALAYPYPPLYPVLIAGIQQLGLSAESAGLLITLAADLFVLFPLVAVARAAAGEAAAWGAAFLWAIHPYAIRLGVQALTDAPTAVLVALAVWAGLRALDEGHLGWAIGAGAASGFAYLFRPEGIEPALVFAVLYIRHGETAPWGRTVLSGPSSAADPKTRGLGKRAMRRTAWAVAPLAGWMIIALPYVAYISKEAGSFTLSKKKSASALLRSLTLPGKDPGWRSKDGSMLQRPSDEAPTAEGWGRGEARRARQNTAIGDATGPILPPSPDPASLGWAQHSSFAFAQDMRSRAAERWRDDTNTGRRPEVLTAEAYPSSQLVEQGADNAVRVAMDLPQSRLGWMAASAYSFQKPLVNGVNPLILIFGFLAAVSYRSWESKGSGRIRGLLLGLLGLHFAVLVGLAADYGASYLGGHHFFLMVLYALPFAGGGLAWTLAWGTHRLRAPRWLGVAALALLVVGSVVWAITRGPDRGVAVRPAAAWIRAHVVGTPVVVTNIAKLTYHARAVRVDLGGAYEDILRRGRERSAQFIVFYPDLMPLVSHDFLEKLNPTDLELAKSFPEPFPSAPNQRLEVYRLRWK
jgi:4-amino-4-deoxy-L-arabinose transferase-like glycosyltransferase